LMGSYSVAFLPEAQSPFGYTGELSLPHLLLSVPIVLHFKRFVKREFFADFSWSFFTRCTLITHLGVPCGDFPLDNYSIAFRDRFVNSFFHIFRKFFSLAL
jgi:hypothetical protein